MIVSCATLPAFCNPIVLAFGLAAIVFVAALWHREYGIFIVIIIWPAYLVRTSLSGIPTTALELPVYALFMSALVIAIVRRRFTWPKISKRAYILMGLWILAWALATIFSTDRHASSGAVKAWLVDPLMFGAVLWSTIDTAERRRLVLCGVATSGTIVALAGLYQYVFRHSLLQDGRLSSFFYPVANYAAMYLGPILILTVGLLLWKQLHRAWWAAAAIMALAMVLTVSFGGYLAVAVAGLYLWWCWPASRKKNYSLGAIVAVAIIAIGILSQTRYFAEHFQTTDRSSGLVRNQIWRTSWKMIEDRPIFGVGPNAYEAVYRETIPKLFWPPLEWLVSQPHNLALALWLETGLLGVLVFGAAVFLWARGLWPRVRDGNALAIASAAAMIALLVHGLVDTPFFKNDLSLLFVLMLVLPWLVPSRDADTR